MIINKIFAFLFVFGLFLQTTNATGQASVLQKAELSPELKRKSLDLLSAAARESGQFKLAENRVQAQTIIADLMWAHDERAAREIYQKALAELQNLFEQINAAPTGKMSDDEMERHY